MSDNQALLIDFYGNFDRTTDNLFVQEPLWNACSSCTDAHCCKNTNVPMTVLEWDLIKSYVRDNFSRHNKSRYLDNVRNKSASCPFLFGHRCSIYAVRPWVCRMHPYTITFRNENIQDATFEGGTFVLPACPKLSARFGVGLNTLNKVKPYVIENNPMERLAKLNLPEVGDFWVIDRSQFFTEFIELTPKLNDGTVAADILENFIGSPLASLTRGKIGEKQFNVEIGLD
jgi:Fe-S-cluster containining protein